jgi:hypothetical protein
MNGQEHEALAYLADPENWLGDPHDQTATLHGHDTPYELAVASLAARKEPPQEDRRRWTLTEWAPYQGDLAEDAGMAPRCPGDRVTVIPESELQEALDLLETCCEFAEEGFEIELEKFLRAHGRLTEGDSQ